MVSFIDAIDGKAKIANNTNRKKEAFPVRNLSPNLPVYRGEGPMGDIGLELEFEGRNLPGQSALLTSGPVPTFCNSQWIIHDDGSLRNGGKEYVLSVPCLIEEVEPLLDKLWETFAVKKTVLVPSNRTSTHVHINVSKMKINELTSFVCLWLMLERPLVTWCGHDRTGNHFCLTTRETSFTGDAWRDALSSGVFRFDNNNKYCSMNLAAFSRFGSLEFRTMRACTDPTDVILWTKFLYALREEAKTTFKNPVDLSGAISEQGSLEIFRGICERNDLMVFFEKVVACTSEDSFNRECMQGFRSGQECLYMIDWTKWMDSFYEPYIPKPFSKDKSGAGFYNNEAGLIAINEILRMGEPN